MREADFSFVHLICLQQADITCEKLQVDMHTETTQVLVRTPLLAIACDIRTHIHEPR